MSGQTICHHLIQTAERFENQAAIQVSKKRNWVSYTWSEYLNRISEVAGALQNLGAEQGTAIAILSATRAEWSYCDHAIMGLGGITVPIYQSTTAEDLRFVLQDSASEILFVENKQHLALWNEIKEECPQVKHVICFPGAPNGSHKGWKDFLEFKGDYSTDEFKKNCQNRKLDETATLIYTSGTTGVPKGVVLTHQQIISEIEDTFAAIEVHPSDVSLSFLPYAHVLGRIEHWGHAYRGFQLAYAENFERIKQNIQSVRPTILIAVPRIFEKIHSRILSQAEATLRKRKLFAWTVQIGTQVSRLKSEHKTIPLPLFLQYELAKRLVFNPIYEALGGRLRVAICGGAPLARPVAEFFDAAGLLILEGYGLTETTGAITVNRLYDYEFGTVGRPVGDTQIKIAADGEILVSGKTVMKEYHNAPEDTAQALQKGWFHTGDIGEWTASGRLKITDRKKDLIKTAGGKYIAPQKLEKLVTQHPLISHTLIHGDAKKFVVALITLDPEPLKAFADKKSISYSTLAQLSLHDAVNLEIRNHIRTVNSALSGFETIKKFKILPEDFSIETGELTHSLKVKRKFCDEKYRDSIEQLYTS